MFCSYCREKMDPKSPFNWQRVSGWERKGMGETRKGGSDIALRAREQWFACDTCITRLKRGVAPTQGQMFT
jgi:hypothetical protein